MSELSESYRWRRLWVSVPAPCVRMCWWGDLICCSFDSLSFYPVGWERCLLGGWLAGWLGASPTVIITIGEPGVFFFFFFWPSGRFRRVTTRPRRTTQRGVSAPISFMMGIISNRTRRGRRAFFPAFSLMNRARSGGREMNRRNEDSFMRT